MDHPAEADQSSRFDIQPLKRRLGRLSLFLAAASVVVLGWGLLAAGDGSERVFGWSPLVWMNVGIGLIGIVGTVIWYQVWRCPECRRYLGNVLNPRFCPRCGVELKL